MTIGYQRNFMGCKKLTDQRMISVYVVGEGEQFFAYHNPMGKTCGFQGGFFLFALHD